MLSYRIANLIRSPKMRQLSLFLKRFTECSPNMRLKYTQHNGVKGIRNRKAFWDSKSTSDDEKLEDGGGDLESLNIDDREYDEVVNTAMNVTRNHISQNVLVIQPYLKWGPKKNNNVSPQHQLNEAEALIRSLPNWSIGASLKVPLETLERKTLFGSGKMEEIKALVHQQRQIKPLTCIFVSKATLSFAQKRILESEFGIPVMDRYSIVIQILRLHATSAEARLQVAMAEIPYIWAQAKDANLSMSRKQGYSLSDTQKDILKTREKKLKLELERIRGHRKLLRNKRKRNNYPIVAVVGYTNAGKTSLIKAITNEESMQPRDQLFATLDVTAHAGILPCNLEVIYMDTVGFMSDLPTGLIECFVATLEDAMLADVIVHVQDLSHECYMAQKKHVEETLYALARNLNVSSEMDIPPIINVGNKIDLVPVETTNENDLHLVSSKTKIGLNDLLLEIEQKILIATGRKRLIMRVRNGGNEIAWLYKNAAVVDMRPCDKNVEYLLVNVIISDLKIQQFKQQFCK